MPRQIYLSKRRKRSPSPLPVLADDRLHLDNPVIADETNPKTIEHFLNIIEQIKTNFVSTRDLFEELLLTKEQLDKNLYDLQKQPEIDLATFENFVTDSKRGLTMIETMLEDVQQDAYRTKTT